MRGVLASEEDSFILKNEIYMKENFKRFVNLMFHKFFERIFTLGLCFFLYIDW